MAPPPVTIRVTREELEERRRVIIEELGVPIETLRHRAMYESLSPDEWEAIDELREIGFLLDDVTGDF